MVIFYFFVMVIFYFFVMVAFIYALKDISNLEKKQGIANKNAKRFKYYICGIVLLQYFF